MSMRLMFPRCIDHHVHRFLCLFVLWTCMLVVCNCFSFCVSLNSAWCTNLTTQVKTKRYGVRRKGHT